MPSVLVTRLKSQNLLVFTDASVSPGSPAVPTLGTLTPEPSCTFPKAWSSTIKPYTSNTWHQVTEELSARQLMVLRSETIFESKISKERISDFGQATHHHQAQHVAHLPTARDAGHHLPGWVAVLFEAALLFPLQQTISNLVYNWKEAASVFADHEVKTLLITTAQQNTIIR